MCADNSTKAAAALLLLLSHSVSICITLKYGIFLLEENYFVKTEELIKRKYVVIKSFLNVKANHPISNKKKTQWPSLVTLASGCFHIYISYIFVIHVLTSSPVVGEFCHDQVVYVLKCGKRFVT